MKKSTSARHKKSVFQRILQAFRSTPHALTLASMESAKVSPVATFGVTFFQQIYEAYRDLSDEDRRRLPSELELSNLHLLASELEGDAADFDVDWKLTVETTRTILTELSDWDADLPPYQELRARLDRIDATQRHSSDRLFKHLGLVLHDAISSELAQALAVKETAEAQRFESDYLARITKRFQYLESIGTYGRAEYRQKLDTAFVTLNLQHTGQRSTNRLAEQVVSNTPLLTIHGPAGSGKTTLLRWIQLACGRPVVDRNPWHGFVPFFIPLRSVPDGKVNLARLVHYTFDEADWPRKIPDNWIEDTLRSKRAVLLVDGVDELSRSKRSAFWACVRQIVEGYPGNRIMITSRPFPSSDADDTKSSHRLWQSPPGFRTAEVQELTDDQIHTLIDRWHEAVIEGLSYEEEESRRRLESAKHALPRRLSEPRNRRVRELCGTPLLCSLVCALHWREDGYLPTRRVDLYERCCEMLIEARDQKRGVSIEEPYCHLTRQDKQIALQRLAYAMMKNGDSGTDGEFRLEVSRAQAERLIRPAIRTFGRATARKCAPKGLIDHLIERTGLLREPAKGRIDFQHRTFQEYLAACEAGNPSQNDDYRFLANLAFNDAWHGTITLAAGTPIGGVRFGRDLIDALLKKADSYSVDRGIQRLNRRKCIALAAGCLDTLRAIDPTQRDEVLKRLKEIVPPCDVDEAAAVAAAGEFVVPMLDYNRHLKEDERTVACCARALYMIGSPNAVRELQLGYGSDTRNDVLVQVCALPELNPLSLSGVQKRVKAFVSSADDSRLLPKQVRERITSLETLSELSILECPTTLSFTECPNLIDLGALSRLTFLEVLSLSGCTGVTDLHVLADLRALRVLFLSGCTGVTDLSALSRLPVLKRLFLEGCTRVTDLESLWELATLTVLFLSGCTRVTDLSPLSGLRALKVLYLDGCTGVTDLRALSGLTELYWLSLSGCTSLTNLSALAELKSLQVLSLSGCTGVTNLDALSGLTALQDLYLDDCTGVTDLAALSGLTALEDLSLDGCTGIKIIPSFVREILDGA